MSVLQLFLAIACVFPGLLEARRSHDESIDSQAESDHHLDVSWSPQQDEHNASLIEGVATVEEANKDYFASRDSLWSRQNDVHNASFIERVATGAGPVDKANHDDIEGELFHHEWVRFGIGLVVVITTCIFLAYYLSCRKGGKGEGVDQASTSSDCPPAADAAQGRDLKGVFQKTVTKAVILNRLSGGWFVQPHHYGLDAGDLMLHADEEEDIDPKQAGAPSSSAGDSMAVQGILFFLFGFSLVGESVVRKLSQDVDAETGKSAYPYEPLFVSLLTSIILVLSGYTYAICFGGFTLLKQCFNLHLIAVYTPSACLFRIGGIFDLLSLQYLPVDLWGFAASVFSMVVAAMASSLILKRPVHYAEWMSLTQITLGIALMSYMRSSDGSPSSKHSQFGIGITICFMGRMFRTVGSVLLEKYTQREFSTSFFIQTAQINTSTAAIVFTTMFCFKRPISYFAGRLDRPVEVAHLMDGWDTRTIVVLIVAVSNLFLSELIVKYLSTVLKTLSGTFATCISFCVMIVVWPSEYPFQWPVAFAWMVLTMALINHTVTRRLILTNSALKEQLEEPIDNQKKQVSS